ARAEAWFGPISLELITGLARDKDPRERLVALALMQRQIYQAGVEPIVFFPLARELVADPDNTCRWQALIVVSESIETHPGEVWRVVVEHAHSPDEDMRAGVACVVLEHLIDLQFDVMLPWLRAELLKGSETFAQTVDMCWFDHNEGLRYRTVQKLLRNSA